MENQLISGSDDGITIIEDTKTSLGPVKQIKTLDIIEQKYVLSANRREGAYHPLPAAQGKQMSLREYKGRIGSEFISNGGQATSSVLRGLSTDQEWYYAHKLINKNPKDPGYDEAMTIYWAEFFIDVPEQGLKFDASYRIDTVKLVDGRDVEIQIPTLLDQYIKANYAKKYSRVAFTEEEKANSYLYDFLLTDLSIAKRQTEEKFRLENRADLKYGELVKAYSEGKINEKVDYLLDVLKDENEHFYSSSSEEKMMRLKSIKTNKPEEFIAAYDDVSLAVKSLVFRLIQTRVLTKEGETYFNGDISIGGNKELIAYLQDQTKSGEVAKLKAKLQQILKTPVISNA